MAVLVESDSAAEQLVRSLTAEGYGLSALVEQDTVGRLATVRLISPNADGVGVVVDLIFATAGIEAEIVADAEVLLARDDETRPQDSADLQALALVLGPEDQSTARTAVEFITQRGYARGRSLSAMLDEYLDNAGTA